MIIIFFTAFCVLPVFLHCSMREKEKEDDEDDRNKYDSLFLICSFQLTFYISLLLLLYPLLLCSVVFGCLCFVRNNSNKLSCVVCEQERKKKKLVGAEQAKKGGLHDKFAWKKPWRVESWRNGLSFLSKTKRKTQLKTAMKTHASKERHYTDYNGVNIFIFVCV